MRSAFVFLLTRYVNKVPPFIPMPRSQRGIQRNYLEGATTPPPDPRKKRCRACGSLKSRSEFRRYFDSGRYRYRPRCKQCEKNKILIQKKDTQCKSYS